MSADSKIETYELLVRLTLELTKLKLKEVPHLCIENFSSELLQKLIRAIREGEYGR